MLADTAKKLLRLVGQRSVPNRMIAELRALQADLAILDHYLPKVRGWAVLRMLGEIPVIEGAWRTRDLAHAEATRMAALEPTVRFRIQKGAWPLQCHAIAPSQDSQNKIRPAPTA